MIADTYPLQLDPAAELHARAVPVAGRPSGRRAWPRAACAWSAVCGSWD